MYYHLHSGPPLGSDNFENLLQKNLSQIVNFKHFQRIAWDLSSLTPLLFWSRNRNLYAKSWWTLRWPLSTRINFRRGWSGCRDSRFGECQRPKKKLSEGFQCYCHSPKSRAATLNFRRCTAAHQHWFGIIALSKRMWPIDFSNKSNDFIHRAATKAWLVPKVGDFADLNKIFCRKYFWNYQIQVVDLRAHDIILM